MEQFLNLFWFAITLAVTSLWVMAPRGQRRPGGRDLLEEVTGLGCIFLLLFFAISMTDDLNSQLIFVEEGDQRHVISFTCQDHPSPSRTVGKLTPATPSQDRQTSGLWQPLYNLAPVEAVCQSAVAETLPPDRSPPPSRA